MPHYPHNVFGYKAKLMKIIYRHTPQEKMYEFLEFELFIETQPFEGFESLNATNSN